MDPSDVKKLTAARTLLYAGGLTDKEIDAPNIAIVYSPNEITPGHFHLDHLADAVAQGVWKAGGTPRKITAGVGVCDGIAMGHDGMKYSLPSRDHNADAVEIMVRAHGNFDGVVYIAACDKNIPGYLMAAARLNLPGIFVTAGPMMPGECDGKFLDVVDSFGAESAFALNKMSEGQYKDIRSHACPGAGTCSGMFTANSMACVTEALGLTLPGMAATHALDIRKYTMARASGERIMDLVRDGITVRDILSKEAFYNAFAVDMAIGASTNTVLHLPAIAKEAGFDFDLAYINSISQRTPNLVRLSPAKTPSGKKQWMIDLYRAGGIPVVMKKLRERLDTGVMTVTGPLGERLEGIEDIKSDVIMDPYEGSWYSPDGGIAILHGSLAPEGSVIKKSALPQLQKGFKGKAVVFESEEEAEAFIKAGKLKKGQVIVIRNEGDAGGPGKREMLYPTSAVNKLGMGEDVALATDGRFSGGTVGLCVGHVEREAFNGGPIGLVEDGDEIEIDLINNRLELHVPDSELSRRRKSWKRLVKEVPPGILERYRKEHTLDLVA